MLGLFSLPLDLWLAVLSDWLSLKSIGLLDVACVNREMRAQFLISLKSFANIEAQCPKKRLGDWFYSRNIKIQKLVLRDYTLVNGSLPFNVHCEKLESLDLFIHVNDRDKDKILRLVDIIHSCGRLKTLYCCDVLILYINDSVLSQLEGLFAMRSTKETSNRLLNHCRSLKSFSTLGGDCPSEFCRLLMVNNCGLRNIRFQNANIDIFNVISQNGFHLEEIVLHLTVSWNLNHIYTLVNSCPLLRNLKISYETKLVSWIRDNRNRKLIIRVYEAMDWVPFVKLFPLLTSFELSCSEIAVDPVVEEVLLHSKTSLTSFSCNGDTVSDELFKQIISCPHLIELIVEASAVKQDYFSKCKLQCLTVFCPRLSLNDVMGVIRACVHLNSCCFFRCDDEHLDEFTEFVLTYCATHLINVYVSLTTGQTLEFRDGNIMIVDKNTE